MKSACRLGGMALLAAALVLGACGGNNTTTDGGTGGGTGTGGGSGGGAGAGGGSGGGTGTGGGAGGGGGGGAGGGSGGGGGSTASLTVTQFCDQAAAARCTAWAGCGYLDSAQQTTCVTNEKTACNNQYAAANGGALTFNGTQAAACVNALNASACAVSWFSDPAACAGLTGPARTAGQGCSSSTQCTTGTCTAYVASCGKCETDQPVGARCDDSLLDCDPNAGFCPVGSASDGGLADGGQRSCLAYAAVGSPCSITTGSIDRCNPATAYCPPTAPTDGGVRLCIAKVADGQPCTTDQTCLNGNCYPQSSLDGGQNTCKRAGIGEGCTSFNDCNVGLDCNQATSSCITLYSVPTGGGCWYDDHCVPNAFCDITNDTCTARKTSGACDDHYQCVDGYACDFAFTGTDTCVPRQSKGGSCAESYMCKWELWCPKVPAGQPTDGGFDGGAGAPTYYRCSEAIPSGGNCLASNPNCAAGTFCDLRPDAGTTRYTCLQKLPDGAGCTTGTQCMSGSCPTTPTPRVCAATGGFCAP